jgi:transcription elongation factor Elf1
VIVKQLDEPVYMDRCSKAGYEAEKQMAYYLRHHYADSNKVFVFNNIRFKWLDDYTQIDHLIMHEYGMVIVESKSVTSKIKFNELGEWTRLWDRHWEGMRNPVKQAERQGESLRSILTANKENLLRKIFGKNIRSFDKMPIDVVVAISDRCSEIKRPRKNRCPNVVKADLVTEYIEKLIEGYRKKDDAFSLSIPWAVSVKSMTRIKDFLLTIHEPLVVDVSVEDDSEARFMPKPTKPATSEERFELNPKDSEKIYTLTKCPECGGTVCILWGARYNNYYWHCNDCGKNISINAKCPECKQKLRIRKQANDYFIYCEPCELEVLYHSVETNK